MTVEPDLLAMSIDPALSAGGGPRAALFAAMADRTSWRPRTAAPAVAYTRSGSDSTAQAAVLWSATTHAYRWWTEWWDGRDYVLAERGSATYPSAALQVAEAALERLTRVLVTARGTSDDREYQAALDAAVRVFGQECSGLGGLAMWEAQRRDMGRLVRALLTEEVTR